MIETRFSSFVDPIISHYRDFMDNDECMMNV